MGGGVRGRRCHRGDLCLERPGDLAPHPTAVVLLAAVVALAHIPAAVGIAASSPEDLDGPRDHSGTGVASRPTAPLQAAHSRSLTRLRLASMSSLHSASSALRRRASSSGSSVVLAWSSSALVSRRFFFSPEGSRFIKIAWNR